VVAGKKHFMFFSRQNSPRCSLGGGGLQGSRMKKMRDLAINPRKGRKKSKAVRIDLSLDASGKSRSRYFMTVKPAYLSRDRVWVCL
jgi:hypothetical protein